MGYPVTYDGKINITPAPIAEHEALLIQVLNNPAGHDFAPLGISENIEEIKRRFNSRCYWEYEDGFLTIPDVDASINQATWLHLLVEAFFVPNGYILSGAVTWQGENPDDSGTIYVENNQIEAVEDTITNDGPSWGDDSGESERVSEMDAVEKYRATNNLSEDLAHILRTLVEVHRYQLPIRFVLASRNENLLAGVYEIGPSGDIATHIITRAQSQAMSMPIHIMYIDAQEHATHVLLDTEEITIH